MNEFQRGRDGKHGLWRMADGFCGCDGENRAYPFSAREDAIPHGVMKRGRFKFLGRNHLIEKSIDLLAFLFQIPAHIHGRLNPSIHQR
jgi:hypothetical protein